MVSMLKQQVKKRRKLEKGDATMDEGGPVSREATPPIEDFSNKIVFNVISPRSQKHQI